MKYSACLALLLVATATTAAAPATTQTRQAVKKLAVRAVQRQSSEEGQSGATLGVGVGVGPLYAGSRAYDIAPIPYAQGVWQSQDWGVFSAGNSGLGWTPYANDNLQATLLLGYDGGRDETFDHSRVRGSQADRDFLRGMGKLKGTTEGGLAVQYQLYGLALSLQAMHDLQNRGHGGTWVDLGLTGDIEIAPSWSATLGVQSRWADADYMNSYFGVSAAQAASSQFQAYRPGAGLQSVGLNGTLSYAISEHWSLIAMAGYSQLVSEAADSPIVQSKHMLSGVVGAAYHF